jgi:hypothetical protein
MERHLSTGIATIVALMAAHRLASGREGPPAAYSQKEVARIDAYLHEKAAPKAIDAKPHTAIQRIVTQ